MSQTLAASDVGRGPAWDIDGVREKVWPASQPCLSASLGLSLDLGQRIQMTALLAFIFYLGHVVGQVSQPKK